jgi:hypothetical protein
MNRCLSFGCAFLLLAGSAIAAGKAPEIQIINGKVSMQADAVPLGRLLRLFDSATGMTSKVPPELTNRNVSVRFSGLPFDAAVRKIFEGQPLDYIVIKGKGIVVTALAQTTTPSGAAPSPFEQASFPQTGFVPEQDGPPVFNPQPAFNQPQPINQPQPQQGIVTQTPFGPLPVQQPQPIPTPGFGQPQQPSPASPFGTFNPFGQPTNPAGASGNQAPATPNPLFGNTAPTPFQQNPTVVK